MGVMIRLSRRILQKLAIEMYKVKNDLSPVLVQEIFSKSSEQNLRHEKEWEDGLEDG